MFFNKNQMFPMLPNNKLSVWKQKKGDKKGATEILVAVKGTLNQQGLVKIRGMEISYPAHNVQGEKRLPKNHILTTRNFHLFFDRHDITLAAAAQSTTDR